MPPNRLTVSAMPALTASSFVTSMERATARPPLRTMSSATFVALGRFRSATTTVAPSSASLRAHCSPIPLAAPVTSATLSFNAIYPPGELLVHYEFHRIDGGKVVVRHLAHIECEIGDDVTRADYLANGQVRDRSQRVRMKFERSRPFPGAGHLNVAQKEADEFAYSNRAVDVRYYLEQIVRCVGQFVLLGSGVERTILIAHRAGGNSLRAVVERSEQGVFSVNRKPRRSELLGKAPDFPAAGDRTFVVQIHRVRVVRLSALLVQNRDDLTALRIVAKPRRIRHADELVMNDRVVDFQRLGNDGS